MDEPPREPPPPPDPGRLTGQVVVDTVCLILTVAIAILAAIHVAQFRQPGNIASEVLVVLLALAVVSGVVFLGVWCRSQVRALFGVTDTARPAESEDPAGAEKPVPADVEEDDLSEPTVCLVCRRQIPAGTAACPSCGWTYQQQ